MHGPPGLGKTHLLHAIGNYVERYGGGLRVRYATVEEFTSEFVEAVRERRTPAFKDRFRKADVVLIDDVQFLARKDRTREEFFHTFNALYESGPPARDDLRPQPRGAVRPGGAAAERFRSGLVVELEPPGFDVRRAILAQARPARRPRGRRRGDRGDRSLRDEQRAGARGRADPRGGLRLAQRRRRHAGPRAPRPRAARGQRRQAALRHRARSSTRPRRSSASSERRCSPATAGPPSRPRARSRCTSRASSPTTAFPRSGAAFGGRNHTTVLHAVNRVIAACGDSAIRKPLTTCAAASAGPG